jgi:flagella basal body P-ring formation protein FlgA
MQSRHGWLKVVLGMLVFLCQSAAAVETGRAVVDLVRERYQLDSTAYEIEIVSIQLKTRLVNLGDLSIKSLTQTEPIGPFTVMAEINNNGVLIERGQVRLRVSKFAEVLVAADNVGRHELLSETKFELKRCDVTSLREQPVTSQAELGGMRAKRNLRTGNILTTGAIEPVPDIDVGGEVTIVFTDNWGSITAPGEALEAGTIGARVRIKNLASGKIILATVVSGNSVEVNP